MSIAYEDFCKTADEIKKHIPGFEPEIGLILGSDFKEFEKRIEKPVTLFYKDIGCLLSHNEGKMVFGYVGGKKVVVLVGRNHFYNGYDFQQSSIPIFILKLLETKKLITTNIVGAINLDYKVGDIMIIKDHINLTGQSALRGLGIDEFGPQFPEMSQAYSPEMIRVAETCAREANLNIQKGIYFYFAGPQFETPAEIRAARILGGDVAGMSTINEVQAAAKCGIPLLGLSLVSNMAAGVLEKPISLEEINASLDKTTPLFEEYLSHIIASL